MSIVLDLGYTKMHVMKQKMSAVHLSLASLGVTVELPGRKTGLLSIPEIILLTYCGGGKAGPYN